MTISIQMKIMSIFTGNTIHEFNCSVSLFQVFLETSLIESELEIPLYCEVQSKETLLPNDPSSAINDDLLNQSLIKKASKEFEPTNIKTKKRRRPRQINLANASDETNEHFFSRLLLTNLALKNPAHKRLSCDYCGYSSPEKRRIREHMIRFHITTTDSEALQKPYCCEICGIRMSDMGNLNQHKRLHTGLKKYPCLFESCDQRFFGSSERTTHMRRHTGEKPYKCDECSNAFISKSHLNTHKRNRHSDHRPFHCDECGYTFKQLRSLANHQLTHTDIRDHRCDVCGRSFRQKSAFRVHMNIHTDNRPYTCSICDLGFHSSAARSSHVKTVHKII